MVNEIEDLQCNELREVRSDAISSSSNCRSFITYRNSSENCQDIPHEDEDYLDGIIVIKCTRNDGIICLKSEMKFRCTSCEDDANGRGFCNCNCMAECEVSDEKETWDIISTVNITQQVISRISTNQPTSPTINEITDAPTANNTTIRNNSSPTPDLPLNTKQYLAYVLPIGGIFIILLIAVLIPIIVCLICRRVLSKGKDPELDTHSMDISQLYINPHISSTNESNYSTISEIEPNNTCNSLRNHSNQDTSNGITSNRLSENMYQEIRSSLISEATTPGEMIQNVLYNFGATNETDISNNFYHVLVAGEVIQPNIYDQIIEVNSLYSKDNTSNEQRDFHNYIEPPKNFPELKHMVDAYIHEIKAEDIEIGEEFASGQFGVVYRGKYSTGKGDIPVAIKTLKETVGTNKDTKMDFMREAAILTQFHHPYVLRLIGILTTQEPWMMVTELLKTELRQLLLQIRPTASSDKLNIQNLLLKFSQEIAAGMEHLADKKFIHRDLAARNVLVAKDLSVRVADFGMSRGIDCDNDYYTSSGGGRVPLRWTAPEALFYNKFSEKSDVWSFGMTLYEIWSLGDKPWEGCNNEEVIQALTNGDTLSQPVQCPDQIYQIMLETWKQDKDYRPSFSQLNRELNLPI
ncbi:hypothetical protein LOD99_432 [Oopsacas minuta]|uniref:Protein kinase domain-containing protein n=1 Tax=Oopsacas minuta TaxID=111878 RepID=A0AAV7K8X0_9METZ|nr:hypothetical protein LOD99_432 [Oopsacas minuta]